MNRRYEIKQPPTFTNYYKRMQQQKKREIARKLQEENEVLSYRLRSQKNADLSRYERSNKRGRPPATRQNPRRDAAPVIQYSKYLDDTTNVFYEDRKESVSIRKYEVYQPLVLKIALFLFIGWFILFFVRPYPGICPQNADCGVYVYCKEGYFLFDKKCVISKQTKQRVSYLCESIVTNLKYEYGNQDCQSQNSFKAVPYKSTSTLIDQYGINNRASQEEMFRWFRESKNQQKYGFSFYNNEVRPTNKEYTIFCKFQKVVGSRGFYVIFVGFVLLSIFILCWIRLQTQRRRAVKIYEALKKQVVQKGEITIVIEQIEKEFGRVYGQLWNMVDTARVEDRTIAYYEDEKVHWRLV